MKKYLPIILLLLGVAVFGLVYFFVIRGDKDGFDEEAFVPEVPLVDRPFTSLTPKEDGHWLKLVIKDIGIEAAMVDYELLYQVGDGRTQGVPGSINLDGAGIIERDLLLGSESSGKFRYDEGVEEGSLTLRFRDAQGKLVGKLSTQFHLQTDEAELTSLDEKFTYTLAKKPTDTFFVTMGTFGLPTKASLPGEILAGPYGVFASETVTFPGKVELGSGDYYFSTGADWQAISDKASSTLGTFISVSSE